MDLWPNVIKQFHNFAESIKNLADDKNYLNHLNDSEIENNHSCERIQMFAKIWRIKFQVNLKRDSDDDEEEAEISNNLRMYPTVLLACLRIDSYYKPLAIIPSINLLLKVSKTQANLMKENEDKHEAAKLNIDSLQIVSQHYDENCENLNIKGEVAVDVKDYGCDNLIPFIKNFQIKLSFDINHDKNSNFLTNTIRSC
ncbi:hypothetical protein PVAND_005099 [Polypedilum vanderplanki]|uniref:Uncharacterized protein n=1 Tax=Polypedilum vanderplanki TaxID=319348 RepID=A0A9J6C113_POLVA|nr:hypothetical protein PVAND_005099 [Polypedilum vanderplanki]